MRAATLRWPLFAVLGLLVAVGVALLANKLVSESIGITSEPISAGESLTPKHPHRERHRRKPHRATARAQTTSTPAASGYTGTSPSGGSGEGGSDGGSDRSASDDPKATARLPSTTPPGSRPAPASTTPSGGGSDSTPGHEPGDD